MNANKKTHKDFSESVSEFNQFFTFEIWKKWRSIFYNQMVPIDDYTHPLDKEPSF